MRAPGVFFPLLSLVHFLRCRYQECDFLSEIVNLRRRLLFAAKEDKIYRQQQYRPPTLAW